MTKRQRSELARAFAALRKTHGGPPIKTGTPEEMAARARKREAMREWRRKAAQ